MSYTLSSLPSPPPAGERRVYLMRHGQTDLNLQKRMQGRRMNPELDATGREQAHKLANKLESCGINFDCVVTSGTKRARETADIVIGEKETHAEHWADLAEIDWGIWDGKVAMEQALELTMKWQEGFLDEKFEGGETPGEVAQRAIPLFLKIIQQPYQNVAFVLHGRLIRIILSQLLHGNLMHMHEYPHWNCTVNVLGITDGAGGPQFQALVLNDHEHISGAAQ